MPERTTAELTIAREYKEHKAGEPCAVIARAVERFGDKAMDLLYGATCFPASDVIAGKQLEEWIVKADAGMTVDQMLGEAEAEMNAAMEEVRKRRDEEKRDDNK